MSTFHKKIGILGGGQLARMLALSAYPLGYQVFLYCEANSESAPQVVPHTTFGSFSDTENLHAFISSVDIIIFESEFVPVHELKKAALGFEHKFIPSLSTLELLQNKLSQKEFLIENNVPTSPFSEVSSFTSPGVYKWASLGYDGKGVLVATEKSSGSEIQKFFTDAAVRKSKIYREDFIDFTHELACIGVRSISGASTTYPCVISKQRNSVCDTVLGPAELFDIPSDISSQIKLLTEHIGEKASLLGSFGVEFFLTRDGKIYVNEIAPRVHNSGHYTQNACRVSQFENHLRAATGLSLGKTDPFGPFIMKNILGVEGITGDSFPPAPTPKTHLHWYGKSKSSPLRKLGHINGVVQTKEETFQLEEEIKRMYNYWENEVKEKTKKNS